MRRCVQETAPVLNVQLTVSKCGAPDPISGATVQALLNGYTARDQPVSLAGSASNVYSGALDFGDIFPDIAFSTSSSLQFCAANQKNIEIACAPRADKQATYANQSVLLNACASYLTSGAIKDQSQAPQQISQACAVIALEMALICK